MVASRHIYHISSNHLSIVLQSAYIALHVIETALFKVYNDITQGKVAVLTLLELSADINHITLIKRLSI